MLIYALRMALLPNPGTRGRYGPGLADAGACVGSCHDPAGPAHDPAPASSLRDAPWKVWQPFQFLIFCRVALPGHSRIFRALPSLVNLC